MIQFEELTEVGFGLGGKVLSTNQKTTMPCTGKDSAMMTVYTIQDIVCVDCSKQEGRK